MKRVLTGALAVALLAGAGPARAEPAPSPAGPAGMPTMDATRPDVELTMDEAVAVALRMNRDVIAAKLSIEEAEFDRVAARLYPNPTLFYQAGNIVIGHGNPGNVASGAPERPGAFSQLVHSAGVSEVIDIWAKRSARMRAADQGLRFTRLQVEDALREVTHAVRSQFAEVLREQSERRFAHEVRDRYADSVRLSRARFRTGEISEAEFRKLELEGLKYENAVIQADSEYALARQALSALLGLATEQELPRTLIAPELPAEAEPLAALTERALVERPDLRAAVQERRFAQAARAAARREAYPDLTLGVVYTHSDFGVSGDNPNTVALNASMPIPLFDRNQANIGRAGVAIRRAINDIAKLELQVRHDVAEAATRSERARAALALYESGGMLERAETSLRVAENSYRAGAISLLELLEAQRTYLETRADYLRALYDRQQAWVDVLHAVGATPRPSR